MKYASLFTGIGGFDLAADRAGMECVLQVEKDKHCLGLLARHWPDVKRREDVTKLKRLPAVDLVCGGFPCQDLSVAGRRAGLAGERSGLWFEFHRLIADALPRWVVVENVPGLLSSNSGEDFAVILRGMAECGYGVAWRILDAQYFGVPQRRRRVFIVGSLGDGRAAQILFEHDGGTGDTPPRRETGEGVARPLANSTTTNHLDESQQTYLPIGFDLAQLTSKLNYSNPKPGDPQPPLNLAAQAMVANPLGAKANGWRGDLDNDTYVAFQQNTRDEVRLMGGDGDIAGALSAEPGMKQQNYIAGAVNSKWAKGTGGPAGDEAQNLIAFTWRRTNMNSQNDISPTHNTGGGGGGQPAILGPMGVRRLTPRECERLQGFPDDWTADQSDSVRYRQLGNAICVPVAEWIFKRIALIELETL